MDYHVKNGKPSDNSVVVLSKKLKSLKANEDQGENLNIFLGSEIPVLTEIRKNLILLLLFSTEKHSY